MGLHEKYLNLVKEDGMKLRLISEQIPELSLAAVKQNGYALKYVEEQTPEICQYNIIKTNQKIL